MALTGLDYFALYRLIDDELPTNASNLIKAINTRNVTKRMTDTFFTLGSMRVISHLVDTPPPLPEEGDTYTVGLAPTGVWSGLTNKVAVYSDGQWNFIEPGDRLQIVTISEPEQEFFYRGSYPAGNWFTQVAGGSGNLRSDGTVPMDPAYNPSNPKDIATKEFVESNVGQGTVTKVNSKDPDAQGEVEVDSDDIIDESGINPTPGSSISSTFAYLDTEKLFRDGSMPMIPGYTPTDEQDIATKGYVDNKPFAVAGKYEYLGRTDYPAAPPVLVDAPSAGEYALYVDEDGLYNIYLTSFDKSNFPFGFYIETMLANNQDTDGISGIRVSEGGALTALLTGPPGAMSGLVKSISRDQGVFLIKIESSFSYNFYNPNPNLSLHLEADLSYSRNRSWLNSSHFDGTIGPQYPFRSTNYIIEDVSLMSRYNLVCNSPITRFEGHKIKWNINSAPFVFNNDSGASSAIVEFNLDWEIDLPGNLILDSNIPTTIRVKSILTEGPAYILLGDNVTLEYEFKSREVVLEAQPLFTGSANRRFWINSATEVTTSYVDTNPQFIDAILSEEVKNITVTKPLTFGGSLSLEAGNIKRITGEDITLEDGTSIIITAPFGDFLWESGIILPPSPAAAQIVHNTTLKLGTIYGNGVGLGGDGGTGGGILNCVGSTTYYQKLVDNAVLSGGPFEKSNWVGGSISSAIFSVSNETELILALESATCDRIIIEKPIYIINLSNVPLLRNKVVVGAPIIANTFASSGILFTNQKYVKFYCDINIEAGTSIEFGVSNAVPDAQLFFRNLNNTSGSIYLTGIGIKYEWAFNPAAVLNQTTGGSPVASVFWDNTNRGSAGVSDGNKGDITVSGNGTQYDINGGAVGNAKLSAVPGNSFKGRTSGAGQPEDLSPAQVLTILNVAPGATPDMTDAQIKQAYENNTNTNAFTNDEKSKLAGLESSKFVGQFTSLALLQAAFPIAAVGSYAYVDAGVGEPNIKYIWDSSDSLWDSSGATGGETPATIKQKYESNPDTNAYTDTEKNRVSIIEQGGPSTNLFLNKNGTYSEPNTSPGGGTTSFTTRFYYPGNLGVSVLYNLGYGMGTVSTPAGNFGQLMPAMIGYTSRLNWLGIMVGGSFTPQAEITITVNIQVYNLTQGPVLNQAITSVAALPNAGSWVLLKQATLTIPISGQRFYATTDEAFSSEPTAGSLNPAWADTDQYICALQISQVNPPYNYSLPNVVVEIDWLADL